MIDLDKKHDLEENIDRYLTNLKENDWRLTPPTSSGQGEPSETSIEEKTPKNPPAQTKATGPKSAATKSPSNTSTITGEGSSESAASQNINDDDTLIQDKKNLGTSVAMAAGITAAAGALGYGAYRAWKKHREKKRSVNREVDNFLKTHYKTNK